MRNDELALRIRRRFGLDDFAAAIPKAAIRGQTGKVLLKQRHMSAR
jgi:hypothetical protein